MKKVICIIWAVFLVFSLTSCDKANENEDCDFIVYVSVYGKIHSSPDCSGMIYYNTMLLADAIREGYVICQNCEDDIYNHISTR